MRTTVTLDEDTLALVRKRMRERGVSFKVALNEAVRIGCGAAFAGNRPAPFRPRTFRMGFRPEFRWDKALALAEAIEDEELVRKLQLGA